MLFVRAQQCDMLCKVVTNIVNRGIPLRWNKQLKVFEAITYLFNIWEWKRKPADCILKIDYFQSLQSSEEGRWTLVVSTLKKHRLQHVRRYLGRWQRPNSCNSNMCRTQSNGLVVEEQYDSVGCSGESLCCYSSWYATRRVFNFRNRRACITRNKILNTETLFWNPNNPPHSIITSVLKCLTLLHRTLSEEFRFDVIQELWNF